jgi:hypothetical protein
VASTMIMAAHATMRARRPTPLDIGPPCADPT